MNQTNALTKRLTLSLLVAVAALGWPLADAARQGLQALTGQ
jgi:hypothetical protein